MALASPVRFGDRDRLRRLNIESRRPGLGDDLVSVDEESHVAVVTDDERTVERWWRPESGLDVFRIDVRCQTTGRIPAVGRSERSAEAAWKSDFHDAGTLVLKARFMTVRRKP